MENKSETTACKSNLEDYHLVLGKVTNGEKNNKNSMLKSGNGSDGGLTLGLRCHLERRGALAGAVPVLGHNAEHINRFWHQVLDGHLCLSRTTCIFNAFPFGNRRFGHRNMA